MGSIARRILAAAVAVTAWLPVGCYSTSLLQETRPLAPGSARVALGLQWHAERSGRASILSGLPGVPAPEAGVRFGLIEGLEARVKAGFVGGEGGINAQVVETEALRLNLLPSLRAYSVKEDDDEYFDEYAVVDRSAQAIALPVILTLESDDAVDLFLGPDVHAGLRDGGGFFAAGAHIGVSIDYGEHVTQILECSMIVGVAGADPAASTTGNEYRSDRPSWMTVGDLGGQCGTSFSFGGQHGGK